MVKINMNQLNELLKSPVPGRRTRHHSPKSELESSVVKQSISVARLNGWYVERRNTGAARNGKSFVRYGTTGGADLIIVVTVNGLPLHIEAEAKRPTGGSQSSGQMRFEETCKSFGIPYFIFTSGIEFEDKMKDILDNFKKKLDNVGRVEL
jgi:hypothetical protein